MSKVICVGRPGILGGEKFTNVWKAMRFIVYLIKEGQKEIRVIIE
jgi:hypothetical protein